MVMVTTRRMKEERLVECVFQQAGNKTQGSVCIVSVYNMKLIWRVENVEDLVIRVVEQSLEFCVCYLERASIGSGEDLNLENDVIQLLKVASIDGRSNEFDISHLINIHIESLRSILQTRVKMETDKYVRCNLQGTNCLKDAKPVDRVLITLATECLQSDTLATRVTELPFHQDLNSVVSLAQHWAVVHLRCMHRLIRLFNKLLLPPIISEEQLDDVFFAKLSFGSNIIKLLGRISKDIPYVHPELLHAIVDCIDTLSGLFKLRCNFANYSSPRKENNFSCIALQLMEEFLELVEILFCDGNIFQNIRTSLVASILNLLDSTVWRYDKASSPSRSPLIYSPQIVIYLLKLVRDVRDQTSHTHHWKEQFDIDPSGLCSDNGASSLSYHIHSMEVCMHKKYTCDEHLKIIFPASKQWVDNLMHLVFFLHVEGVKSRPTVERSRSNAGKGCGQPDLDSVVIHEDEALFGNLFSEVGRPVGGPSDVHDQPSVIVNGMAGSCQLPIQAAIDLLSFLRGCIFSPEWESAVYEDACKTIGEAHITYLLSILQCRNCSSDEKTSDIGVACQTQKTSAHISEACFELLHTLLLQHALSHTLEEYFIDQLLRVENGLHIYNDYTLTLLARAYICRGSSVGHLSFKIYKKYVNFILEKVKVIPSSFLERKEFYGSLPGVFHIEILLMAFHLSSEDEKSALAEFLCASLEQITAPLSEFNGTHLSCWGLLVSRLILVLRHMMLYPRTCPSWLLLHLKSKLRGTPAGASQSDSLNHSLASWVSMMVPNIMGHNINEIPSVGELLHQLIDVASPFVNRKDENALQRLCISWDDLFESLSRILGFWRGQKAEAIVDLIVERYVFVLCWGTISSVSYIHRPPVSVNNSHTLDLSKTSSFFLFAHLLVSSNNGVTCKDVNLSEVIVCSLKQLHSMHLAVDDIALQDWDFSRNGTWLSLILSLLGVGTHYFAIKKSTVEAEPHWMEHLSEDSLIIPVAEDLLSNIFQGDQVGWLFEILSSFLCKYLQVLQKAFLSTFDRSRSNADKFSPMLLLKHTGFDKCKQNELLVKSGCSSQLESICSILPQLDGITSKDENGGLDRVFHRCLFHGFPLNSETSSGILLSCILSIREIVLALDGLVKIKDAGVKIDIEVGVLNQLLQSIMFVKSDKFFQCLYDKCEHIYHSLSSYKDEWLDNSSLFVLKQMEGFLAGMNLMEANDEDSHELVVTSIIDFIEDLQKDQSKSRMLKFFLLAEEQDKEFYGGQNGNMLVLINALDKCYSETVNLKVLNFFVDLLTGDSCPSLKEKIQKKFIEMDLSCLSFWLEKRLLGCMIEASPGIITGKGCSAALRESTMNFVLLLVSSSSDILSKSLHSQFSQAVLMLLDNAFTFYDIHTAKAYFSFMVQLLNEESSMKQLLGKMVVLIEKLAGDENQLNGLKYLFGFLGIVLSDSGANNSSVDKNSGKSWSTNIYGGGCVVSKPVGSGENSDALILASNQETGPASIDCDATSMDEDEDDGTSDGEVASVDKDEEEDSNSERALASKVCTFTSSGSNFMEQHWYFCYTCDLTVSKGCCSVCAKVCHRGHRVVYSRSSRFFCDCGAGGVRGSSCQCLEPRKLIGSNNASSGNNNTPSRSINGFQAFFPFSKIGDQTAESNSDLDDDICLDDDSLRLNIPKEVCEGLPVLLEDLDIEGRVLEICNKLLPALNCKRDSYLSKDKKIMLGEDKVLSHNVDLFQLKKAYKSGSLDLKIKADYSNAKELKYHLSSGSLMKSLLSVNTRGRLAAGEGDKVAIFDVGQLIGQPTVAPVTPDKTNVKPLSKNIVRFEIVHLIFNPLAENYLVVAGYEDCQVLTVNPRGEVTDRLAIELALQGAYIRRVDWVPGSQVQLMVVTNMFVKIYDLSQDNISPGHYFTLPNDFIVDAALVVAPMGRLFLLVLSERGSLYRLELSMEDDVGAKPLKDVVHIPNRNIQSKGLSLYFSSTYRLVFLSYQDGTTLIGRLDAHATSLTEISDVLEEDQDGKPRPAGMHHWKELLVGSGVFACYSSLKSNAAFTVSLGTNEVHVQNMRYAVGSALPSVGITAYKTLSKDKTHCIVLHEDGSLQIYSHIPLESDSAANVNSGQARKLGSGILANQAYAALNPEFPLDFFEKTVCITPDVKLSSEAIKNNDSEAAKQSLTSDDGFLESHSPAGFKRVIKLDEGMRSWYDIPFTIAESLLADEEFTISVGPTFNGSALPRIDSLEIYGRAKDEFGWKEKMDALLDMEAQAHGSNSGVPQDRKKCRNVQTASVQEQVLSDALKLLSRFYSLCRSKACSEIEEANLELNNLKCKKLLEKIFEGDGETLVQSSACHVLQAVFPKKEIYYHVKDTMRLCGVVNSSSKLASRIGDGGPAGGGLIQEFAAQMHVVSKIAMHRRENLAAFLEINGSGVVDGLMQVLWGILDVERPDTQTINSIIVPSVELIYSYAECLALHGSDSDALSVRPAVILLKKLLFSPYEAVQTSSSLAISSRLLQVPFPKQTLLATDDSVENPMSAQIPSDIAGATRGNSQVMIEEDSATSSVQYCCDGCSTVPILRRRWHCNVCPDFDLCESCYEVMDADRLPLPHSRNHPMSAIPIEMDSLVGDGNEIQLSMDELSDAGLLQAAGAINSQNSPSFIHVLEPNEAGDFPSSMNNQRIVSISASKRAVNSLLLRQLVWELKGWMEITSGPRAIPIMQLFYRLSSAVGGPFMDSAQPENLDLEKFVRWFLDEINLDKTFSIKPRTFFGEVVILVFMFFTLMLRNWHQPGTESSQSKSSLTIDAQDKGTVHPSSISPAPLSCDDKDKNEFTSQLLRACSVLRQQAFVNYLMDILQQLVHIFKSLPASLDSVYGSGSGCGALLTIRRDLPAGNFLPFFSDSYAKAHRSDFFMDYHRLLLENTFRLLYSLVRPEKHDKSIEKDKASKTSVGKDLKLDGYQDVLCSYISNSNTTFVRRYARRLFLHLCGSKTHYYNVRDAWQLSNEVRKFYKLAKKSGNFQNLVPYERSVKLVRCLSAISEVASARPRNWQKYCLRHGEILSSLMQAIFCFGEESVILTLKLLNLAFYTGKEIGHSRVEAGDASMNPNKAGIQSSEPRKKKKSDDGNEGGSEKSYLDMEQAVEIFCDKDGSILRNFIDCFLLEWNSSSVRLEAKCVLYGTWHHGKQSFKESTLKSLLKKIKCLPSYGQNIAEYIELMTWLLGKVYDNSSKHDGDLIKQCLSPDIISCMYETLHSQNELLANHPNSRIYNTLSSLVEFDGYYLESEPCVACSCPEVPYSRMKLESIKSETKFTDNRIIVKCTGSYTIQTVTMNVHDARKSKSVKVLNLYYNNRPVADLSELKNNWSLWRRAKSCHLVFNQTELKVEFPIPITACNFMIELDSFYENLQASSLESLQCPRCSRSVTDKHGICSNCHENAYQCRQCRNINYENLDSFLCNECGYSKYGRFEFHFMAKPSFSFDIMENDEDMKKGLAAIEAESENAHRRYQQLLGFKKPLLKLVSSIGEHEIDSQQKDTVQQMMVSLPGPSCKINRKILLLGVLYGEKCKASFDSVSKSVQTLQGLRRVLMNYLHHKNSDSAAASSTFSMSRSPNNCYGCAMTFVTHCLELFQVLSKIPNCKKQLVSAGILSELFENNLHQGPKTARTQARAVLSALSDGDVDAVSELNGLIQKKVMYCLEHHRSMDIALATREDLLLLSETCAVGDEFWEARLRVAFQLLFSSIKVGAKHPAISEHVILPCLRIISQACTPPKTENVDKEMEGGKSLSSQIKDDKTLSPSLSNVHSGEGKSPSELSEKHWDSSRKSQDVSLLSYSEWEKGASYLDFVRRQYKVTQVVKATSQRARQDSQRFDYLAFKYFLRWKRIACRRTGKSDFSTFELGSWVSELVLSACSQSIRTEMCTLISLLCAQNSSRQFQLLNLLMVLLPASLSAGESAAEYYDLLFKMTHSEDARLFLTAKGCLTTICKLMTQEVGTIASQERSLHIDISQGFILHKLIELLSKFLEFILEQLCNMICPSKPEPVYLLILNKSHTQEEFIRGSMTKNPYSSAEIGPLMRDVKNKICHQLDLMGLVEDDFAMELLVAGNIISLDLSIAQVYEQVWKKSNSQSQNAVTNSALLSSGGFTSGKDCPPMTVTYRLQGLDGEATEPMIKELEEDREESQDPEVEFAIAGAVRDCGGLEIILSMIQDFKGDQVHVALYVTKRDQIGLWCISETRS
ncbi:Auxin transport protein BIG [Acorus calamus]|uniref:Auxin transport protein BIG n=1 Tax=Acorus calamus TaxID=4465 RepID=A0AAV9EBU7_ACOCL|nr:Auxin transport protein BIG [Acorus calamus]